MKINEYETELKVLYEKVIRTSEDAAKNGHCANFGLAFDILQIWGNLGNDKTD